jgi:MFS family permease
MVRRLMLQEKFSKKVGITARPALANIVLISNAFIWYSFAFSILKKLVTETFLASWSVHFVGAMLSAVAGAILSDRIHKRTTFLSFWMIIGIISSLTLAFVDLTSASDVLVITFLFGIAFGLGIPTSLGYFAECTSVENRAKLAGLILITNGLGAFLLMMPAVDNIVLQALVLAIWRGCGLIIFLIIKPSQEIKKKTRSVSFKFIFSQRSFILYFIPWIMFSLVNFLSLPVQFNILGSNLVNFLNMIEGVLVGVFAIVGGFLSDVIGRKRIAILGFIMLGIGYATLGIYPENLLSWYFYTLVDGIAWGIFSVIFIITIWGDLSHDASSNKYYAIGGLPYFISNFLRLTVGSYITETVSAYAIFSLTAFFLFLAVFPLMYAPETLPEKKIRERELKGYIDKAKKVKEKYT